MKFKALLLSTLLLASPAWTAAGASDSNNESVSHEGLRKAYEQLTKSSFEKAVKTLCQVIKDDPNSPTARRYMAFALLQEGQAKEALLQLEALSLIQEKCTFDLLLSGVAYDMLGSHEKALEIFRQIMEKEPQTDYYRIKTIDELITLLQYDEALKLAGEGYNTTKDAKIAAIYRQKIGKVNQILRLTDRTAKGTARFAFQ